MLMLELASLGAMFRTSGPKGKWGEKKVLTCHVNGTFFRFTRNKIQKRILTGFGTSNAAVLVTSVESVDNTVMAKP